MTRARTSLMVAALAVALPSCASDPDRMVLGLQYQPTSQIDQSRLQGAAQMNPASRVWINPVIDALYSDETCWTWEPCAMPVSNSAWAARKSSKQ